MSEKYYTAAAVPDISKDGKFIRLVLCDADGKNLVPLIVSTPNMKRIAEMLSDVVKTAEVTYSIHVAENASSEGAIEFKPTPQMYQAKDFRFVGHAPTKAISLVLYTWDSTELHLVFRPTLLHRLLDEGQQAADTQLPDTDAIN